MASGLSDGGYTVSSVLFGFDILRLAYLVLQSDFLPHTVRVMLALDGVASLVDSFVDVLVPAAAAGLVPWILLPAPIAEGALSLRLLVFGIESAPSPRDGASA